MTFALAPPTRQTSHFSLPPLWETQSLSGKLISIKGLIDVICTGVLTDLLSVSDVSGDITSLMCLHSRGLLVSVQGRELETWASSLWILTAGETQWRLFWRTKATVFSAAPMCPSWRDLTPSMWPLLGSRFPEALSPSTLQRVSYISCINTLHTLSRLTLCCRPSVDPYNIQQWFIF